MRRPSAPTRAHTAAAVVIGLDCITGLQTARILARRGIPVVGIASDVSHFCCRTSVVQRVLRADTGCQELIGALEQLGPTLGERAVLYPCTDASVLLVARHRERLAPWFHVALPESDVLEMLLDKTRFSEFAGRIGVPTPRTVLVRDRRDVERAAAELPFPCILKPALRTPHWERHSKLKVYRVETPRELLELYDRCRTWTDALIVQQWIDGPDSTLYSCNCYYDRRGEPVTSFVARKLRQWPPRTGTSCLGEEVRNDVVRDFTLRVFGAARFHGLGYLEVKRDLRTGAHYAIEANVGRPTGRSAIAEAGGVELLYAMYCDTLGLPLPAALEQRYAGAKWIYFRQDVRSAFFYWRRGELSLRDWARSWRGRAFDAVFSWSDPRPFAADLLGGVKALAGLGRTKTREASPRVPASETDPASRYAG